ncbi:MAG: trimethylamine methyltransferase family protein, partial [Thermoplasmata archaeon]
AIEQQVIDSYVWENVRKFMTPISITKEACALEVIKAVGHGNTFLSHIHTARNFKKEIILRDPEKGKFEATMSNRMAADAREIALRILKEHDVPELEKSILKQGDEIIREHEKNLAKKGLI